MNQLSRRRFLRISGVAAAVWMLKPSAAWAAGRAPTNGGLTFPDSESLLRGLVNYIDAHDGLVTLLDADFRVVRVSRSHQALLSHDPAEMCGRTCEGYLSREIHAIVEGIGGLCEFRRVGIYRVDFRVVHHPGKAEFGNAEPLVSTGRIVAIGNPCAPMAYLTTLRPGRNVAVGPSAIISCLDS
jgi:hypothetical protein